MCGPRERISGSPDRACHMHARLELLVAHRTGIQGWVNLSSGNRSEVHIHGEQGLHHKTGAVMPAKYMG